MVWKIVIFVEFYEVNYEFFEFFCFLARNVLYTLGEVQTSLWVSAATRYKPNIANFHLSLFISFDYYFSQSVHKAFYSYTFERGIDMLPKRSTPVDQNLGSESIHSQLSVSSYFCSFQKHSGGSKKFYLIKKVEKRLNP